jgi:hypothetical protein
MMAASLGHTAIVRMILDLAPNTAVDHACALSFTALKAAALYHHADVIRVLADRNADMNLMTSQWRTTALSLAVMPNPAHPDLRAPPGIPDPHGARQLATVRALLRLGAGTHPLPRWQPFVTQFKPKSRLCHSLMPLT